MGVRDAQKVRLARPQEIKTTASASWDLEGQNDARVKALSASRGLGG